MTTTLILATVPASVASVVIRSIEAQMLHCISTYRLITVTATLLPRALFQLSRRSMELKYFFYLSSSWRNGISIWPDSYIVQSSMRGCRISLLDVLTVHLLTIITMLERTSSSALTRHPRRVPRTLHLLELMQELAVSTLSATLGRIHLCTELGVGIWTRSTLDTCTTELVARSGCKECGCRVCNGERGRGGRWFDELVGSGDFPRDCTSYAICGYFDRDCIANHV